MLISTLSRRPAPPVPHGGQNSVLCLENPALDWALSEYLINTCSRRRAEESENAGKHPTFTHCPPRPYLSTPDPIHPSSQTPSMHLSKYPFIHPNTIHPNTHLSIQTSTQNAIHPPKHPSSSYAPTPDHIHPSSQTPINHLFKHSSIHPNTFSS